ncbi:hypothetical protein [Prauserella rugosa]|uniref:Polyketide cyclase/dehydrase/lipid transport protein n=1 Tax=Prauserella rugosa TaxID=43354 RepID=A0A660C8D7_9PSEU|nr:hypothetical protein [Prauserella rugosa]KMS84254.1 hypothetical protein ACZ91_48805 [Streptomyces regensis]TWH18634.1 polyketide cyclase/dehydrase/lipid transport protein [Prauserella rugosa]
MNIAETKTCGAGPASVWEVVGDVESVATWIPALESRHLDGDVRYVTFAYSGGEATERIEGVRRQLPLLEAVLAKGASDLARYVTGTVIPVDGGASAVTLGTFATDVVAAAEEFRAGAGA